MQAGIMFGCAVVAWLAAPAGHKHAWAFAALVSGLVWGWQALMS